MANALDIIQVRYGQKTGEEKTISYPEFLALDSAYLSAREKKLQDVMKKLYQLNQNKPPLFKEFPNWRPDKPLTINALTLTTENCGACFMPSDNVIEFDSSAFNYGLFSTLVHELKHAEDWTREYADMFMASRKDGLARHQLGILLESRARACELTAIMADCLNKKKSFAEFQTEFKKDGVFEFVQTIMPEIKKRYEKALTTGQPFDIQDMQQVATVVIVPRFVASPTYQEIYKPRYNAVCKIDPDDKGLAALPSSWGIASKYHKALLSVLGSSFKDGEVQDKIPIDVLKKLNIEADFSSFLFEAVTEGKTKVVQELIKAGVNVNENDGYGYTPLHLAIKNGKPEVAQVLIEAGADVNVKDKDGNTPLLYAIKNGKPEVAQVLIEAGADVNVKDKDGSTPLHWAAGGGRTEVVKALVQAGAKMEEKDKDGNTPLHSAVWGGRTEVVKALIQAGAKMEEKDDIGNTPLHSAIWGGHTEVVRALVQAGAKMEEKNENGDTPLHFAVGFFNKDIIKALIQAGADVKVKNNEGKTAADLLEERILRARKEGKDVSALEAALKIVKTAEAGGSTLESKSPTAKPAKTPTKSPDALGKELSDLLGKEKEALTEADNKRIAELMNMKHPTQINLNVKDKEGRTLLHKAARLGNVDAVQTLLKSGLDVNAMDKNGKTPMDEAAKAGEIDMVRVLISSGAKYSRNMRKPKRGKQKGVSPRRSTNEITAASNKVPQTNVAKGVGEQAGSNAAEALRSSAKPVAQREGASVHSKREGRV